MCRRKGRCAARALAPWKRRGVPERRCSTVLRMRRRGGLVFVRFLRRRSIVHAFLQRLTRRQAVERVSHGAHQLADALARGGRNRVKLESASGAKLTEFF